jgi:hypothetical protein
MRHRHSVWSYEKEPQPKRLQLYSSASAGDTLTVMSDDKSSTTGSQYRTILLSIGIAAVVLGFVVLAAGGTPAVLFILGGLLIVAWLIIKAAKN